MKKYRYNIIYKVGIPLGTLRTYILLYIRHIGIKKLEDTCICSILLNINVFGENLYLIYN